MSNQNQSTFSAQLDRVITSQRRAYDRDGFPSAAVRVDRLNRAADLLTTNREEIADALSDDYGYRSREETIIVDIFAAVGALRNAAANVETWMQPTFHEALAADAEARVEYIPLGVVGIIGPWNFPYYLTFAPLAGVLAAGNRAIIKPSEFTPNASALMAELVAATFEENEFTVTLGGPSEGADFAAARFDHLIFTGSTSVAKHVMRAAAGNLTPVTLELGGKSPVIITDQFDMSEAAARVMTVKTYNAGQICLAPDYVFVPRGREQMFADACISAMSTMYPAGIMSDDYSSVLTDRHFDRLTNLVTDARDKGAQVIETLPQAGTNNERRFSPTLLVGANETMIAMQEEIFGPVLPLISYDHIDDVLAKIRSGPRPLALYYFGADDDKARKVLDGTASGGVTINDVMTHAFPETLPFGGIGASGTGSYHGKTGFLSFSHARAIYRQSPQQEAALLMRAPYGPEINAFLDQALAG